MGASYGDAADLLTKARDRRCVTCPVVVDAVPRGVEMKRLAEHARADPLLKDEAKLLEKADAATAPTLYSTTR